MYISIVNIDWFKAFPKGQHSKFWSNSLTAKKVSHPADCTPLRCHRSCFCLPACLNLLYLCYSTLPLQHPAMSSVLGLSSNSAYCILLSRCEQIQLFPHTISFIKTMSEGYWWEKFFARDSPDCTLYLWLEKSQICVTTDPFQVVLDVFYHSRYTWEVLFASFQVWHTDNSSVWRSLHTSWSSSLFPM